jgi:hypothetical protein
MVIHEKGQTLSPTAMRTSTTGPTLQRQGTRHSIHVGAVQVAPGPHGPVHVAPIHVDFLGCALLPRQQMDLCTPLTSANSPTHSIFLRIQGCALHRALHYTLNHTLYHALHHALHYALLIVNLMRTHSIL